MEVSLSSRDAPVFLPVCTPVHSARALCQHTLTFNPHALHRRPHPTPIQSVHRFGIPQQRHIYCHSSEPDASTGVSTADASPSIPQAPQPTTAQPSQTLQSNESSTNAGLAGGAVAAGVALFLATRLLSGGPSLAALEQDAVPLDVALSNGRPTVVEFYANW